MNEGLVLGLALGGLIWLVLWRARVPMTPWREYFVTVGLGIVLWLALRAAGIEQGTSLFLGFVAAVFLVAAWKRFTHRPI